jgi:hypothetical protein
MFEHPQAESRSQQLGSAEHKYCFQLPEFLEQVCLSEFIKGAATEAIVFCWLCTSYATSMARPTIRPTIRWQGAQCMQMEV